MTENSSVLGPTRKTDRGGTELRTFSLMEVAQETGIAMPILLRYKREHPDLIPSEGSGSQQRFPEEAFAIFTEIHRKESEQRDLPRRGGFGLLSLPRVRRRREAPADETETTAPATEPADLVEPTQTASRTETADEAPAAPAAAVEPPPEPQPAVAAAAVTPDEDAAPADEAVRATIPAGSATLTLKAISDELGIAYPTIARYATKHEERIPHVGEGRKRRFPPEAIDVFRQIRAESKPGRPPKAKTERKRAAAAPVAPRPAATGAPIAAAPTRPPADLMQRIEYLERRQQQLETMVRSLREELERPVTAIVEPT